MNKEWSDKNKKMQTLINKESTFKEGIDLLIELRNDVFWQIDDIVNNYPLEAFSKMPFKGVDGYHSKTLAYSIWHIFRIEDIVAHTMIAGDEQVLFAQDYVKKTGSPIITTGNELKGDAIAEFSRQLNIKELYNYAKAVKESTDELLRELDYKSLKRRFDDEDKKLLADSSCVSTDEEAVWLIEYWCGKDVKGLIKMPFSRHWIMHVEAMQRIKNKLCKIAAIEEAHKSL